MWFLYVKYFFEVKYLGKHRNLALYYELIVVYYLMLNPTKYVILLWINHKFRNAQKRKWERD